MNNIRELDAEAHGIQFAFHDLTQAGVHERSAFQSVRRICSINSRFMTMHQGIDYQQTCNIDDILSGMRNKYQSIISGEQPAAYYDVCEQDPCFQYMQEHSEAKTAFLYTDESQFNKGT